MEEPDDLSIGTGDGESRRKRVPPMVSTVVSTSPTVSPIPTRSAVVSGSMSTVHRPVLPRNSVRVVAPAGGP